MANLKTDALQTLDDLPIKDCQRRFCVFVGPFTDRRIVGIGFGDRLRSDIPGIVGWCSLCLRRVCSGCALHRSFMDDELGRMYRLECRHCGEPLGVGENSIRLDLIQPEKRGHVKRRDEADKSLPASSVWIQLYRELLRRGVITTKNLLEALSESRAGNADLALSYLQREEQRCFEAGWDSGRARCQLEMGLLFLGQEQPVKAMRCFEEAEEVLEGCGSKTLLERCLRGMERALEKTEEDSQRLASVRRRLAQVVSELDLS